MTQEFPVVPILYIFVEKHSMNIRRASIFHLLNETEIEGLRCLMALTLLPSDTKALYSEQPPFTAAIRRITFLPTFRTADTEVLPSELDAAMAAAPLVIVLSVWDLPKWALDHAERKDLGVLTPDERIVDRLRGVSRVHVGLLKGSADLREGYRVIRGLLVASANSRHLDDRTRAALGKLGARDLFADRPRLVFVPPIPLPAPHEGRPSCYLLNRMSNNVDEPVLMAESKPEGARTLSGMLHYSMNAGAGLALFEQGLSLPSSAPISQDELAACHAALTGPATNDVKFEQWFKLGETLARARGANRRLLLSLPVPRIELLKSELPESIYVDVAHQQGIDTKVKAVKDVANGVVKTAFRNPDDERFYESARHTVLSEQRLLAIQAAWLAGVARAIPVQVNPNRTGLYGPTKDLNVALEKRTSKISEMFRRLSLKLAESLPGQVLEELKSGESPIILFSDYPFEWTAIDSGPIDAWPLCLTRPVSRIPIGLCRWDALSAVVGEQEASINASHPERVLVLDLIGRADSIREFTDSFIKTSESLGQHYTYARPRSANEIRKLLETTSAEIVVIDSHGEYDRRADKVFLVTPTDRLDLDDLLPARQLPPVWIISACDGSVSRALRGSVVRHLLAQGAVCVVATLNVIDAFTASMFVGRLLTEIYSPIAPGMYSDFQEVFFNVHYTTAILYDPLLPLIHRANARRELARPVANVIFEYLQHVRGRQVKPKVFRYEAGELLARLLDKHDLLELQTRIVAAGHTTPETLLFTAFGLPSMVRINDSRRRD